MSEDWTAVAADVAEGIASIQDDKVPMVANIIREGAKSGPEENPTFGPDVLHPCTIFISKYTAYERSGSLIEKNDKKVSMSTEGLTITPTVADRLEINGTSHEIKDVDKLAPADVVVMYTLQVGS